MIHPRLATLLLVGWMTSAWPAAAKSPLDRCWAEVRTRVELKPCLERLLQEAERALETALSAADVEARELDRLSSRRAENALKLSISQDAWRAYREAECARRRAAMEPGTGAGDSHLACRIELTQARAVELAEP